MKSTSSTYIDYAFLGLGCGNSLMLLQLAEEGLLAGKHILVIEPDSNGTNLSKGAPRGIACLLNIDSFLV